MEEIQLEQVKTGEMDWLMEELRQTEFSDPRLKLRYMEIAAGMASGLGEAMSAIFRDEASFKGAERFLDNKKIEDGELLESHQIASLQRIRNEALVLALNDTTDMDYSARGSSIKETGPIHHIKKSRGFFLHTTQLFTPDGIPQGILFADVWARSTTKHNQAKERKTKKIEDKESAKWLRSLEQVNEAAAWCPQTTFLQIGDREEDVYDVFMMERRPNVELLVRAVQDRKLLDENYLKATLDAQPVVGTYQLKLSRISPSKGQYKTPKREGRSSRETTMEVRVAAVTVNPPKHRKAEHLPAVKLWAIQTKEVDVPSQGKRLEWLLLTTMPILTFEAAQSRIQNYATRWSIEIFHRVLKSLEVEESQLKTFQRLRRWVLINCLLAWRVMQLTIFSRKYPDASCLELFSDAEWQALWLYQHQTEPLPSQPPTAEQAVFELAKLGGFRARKCDGPPGPKPIRKGLMILPHIVKTMEIAKARFSIG